MKNLFIFLSLISFLGADELDEYFSLLHEHPHLAVPGEHEKGEIEIVLDREGIGAIEKAQIERLVKKGVSLALAQKSSQVGIVSEDIYWLWIRDAVIFPTGATGTYERIVWKSGLLTQNTNGVAILPVFPDGRIALVLNYRHATRSWELELPRGALKKGETLQETVIRELQAETGLIAKEPILLGSMTPDTGVLPSVVPVFWIKIESEGMADCDFSEAIEGIRLYTVDELKAGLKAGWMEVEMGGEKRRVPLRDPFLTFGLFLSDL
ncbi:MAG: NUDIX hydrolase [Verrucomicrobia bacterium]|nr:NUDIX hydrolase [Verrucomicrobiota bacterium]